ncbi:multidrug resistance-associated protein 4-like [Stylophora pistillata]|uniref:Multidrug resistance-associated protein 4 n=1 Tax=Stylophora pistillata TaxID=50429 RepID=A0A2B4SDU5_STYPI|nr:multidrug resistance-associated protein 4-like [Stylophora pistillata]PFX28844.1 Multidrug resistance-associated protein 4 [Stylophora pistillata]
MSQQDGYRKIFNVENKKEYKEVSFLSALLFQWMNSVFKTGSQRPLDQDDFVTLSEENSTYFLTNKLQASWNKERSNCKKNGKRPKLWKSVLRMFSANDLLIIGFTHTLFSANQFLSPLLLGYLVSELMSVVARENILLYLCALSLCLIALVGTLGSHQKDYRAELYSIRMGSALRGLIYRKTLSLSKNKLLNFTTGQVFDLISNDVKRMEEETILFFLAIPFIALENVLAMIVLGYLIGWQAILAVIFLWLIVPYLAGLSYCSAALRLRTAAASDRRISLLSQVVAGIRSIKMHAWEDEYRERIRDTRRREISAIHKRNILQSTVDGLLFSVSAMATLVPVLTMMLTGHTITPVNVFVLLSYVSVLRRNTCIGLANSLILVYEAYVSLGRIEDFLLLKELARHSTEVSKEDSCDPESSSVTRQEKMNHVSNTVESKDLLRASSLLVSNLTYKGTDRKQEFILQDITFVTPLKSLTAVTGPVGSGKSTLLAAIAGEISETGGTITSQGTIIYLPQKAWVFSGTIRENILFGQPYEEPKYARIVEVCALREDIQRFPDGDQTVVGERGEVLSGGQQARVSLARAVYADGDIYLLDDPLSAVDYKVGQHIFDKCIKGLLSNKTCLLISHQEQYMKDADEVIVLYKGRVLEKGRFTELQVKGVISSTVDPLYKISQKNSTDLNKSFGLLNETPEDPDQCVRRPPHSNEGQSLEIAQEDRIIGTVTAKLYWDYFKSGVHPLVIIIMICFCLITQAMIVAPDVWLLFLTRLNPEDQGNKTNVAIYGSLVGACFIFAIARAYGFLLVSLRCAKRLHDKMVLAILQAPVLFFDSNPAGVIVNRFSNDIGCADEMLPKTFLFAVELLLMMFTAVLIPVSTNPWLLFVFVPLIGLVVYICMYYLKTSRELKRLESISRSPVFSHFSETLIGLDTIRTRGRQNHFVDAFCRYQDVHNQSYIMVISSGRWLGVRLDIIAAVSIGAVALAAVFVAQDAASAGLSLFYIIQSVILVQYGVRKVSDVENYMTSVERVMTYTKLDSEPGYKLDRFPSKQWPNKGGITFTDVSLTYYPGGPRVLREINLGIKGGAKIGVAGRTGAGKSSVVAALMRMPDANGEIKIDDIPIKEINLQAARRCISVLGQNPVLFSGSLRRNLDVLNQYQDVDLWRVLEDVQLKCLVEGLDGQLEYKLLEHGANISVGERQLICLARVLLQRSRIIILDEPTAHVDPETEQTIWKVVRDKLKDSTVITIAHRLNTIRDCEMILVLKDGEVDEFDKFDSLVNKKGSTLGEMARITRT